MHAVYIEQIFRIGEINFRSNMRILQGNLPKHIQIFADINLIGSSPLRLNRFVGLEGVLPAVGIIIAVRICNGTDSCVKIIVVFVFFPSSIGAFKQLHRPLFKLTRLIFLLNSC